MYNRLAAMNVTDLNVWVKNFNDPNVIAGLNKIYADRTLLNQYPSLIIDLSSDVSKMLTFKYIASDPVKLSQILVDLQESGRNTLTEINRINKLSKQARINEIGYDPVKKQGDLYEGDIAQVSESTYGYFKRYTTSAEGDFVSLSGVYKDKVFDVFGLPENVTTYANYDISNFFPSITKHFNNKPNVDYLLLDMRYMNALQKAAVNTFINDNFASQIDRLFILE